MLRIAAVLLALWAGSLVTLCALVAPLLFASLDDRHLAGQTAARLFQVEAWLGLGFATALILLRRLTGAGGRALPLWLIVATAAAPLAVQLVLRPMMAAARLAGETGRFAALHGCAAALFLAACVGALVLVWRLSSRAG